MTEDNLALQITPCCYKVQLNDIIYESEQSGGVSSWLVGPDVTLTMMLPILCRRRMVSTLVVALQEYTVEFLEALREQLTQRLFLKSWQYSVSKLYVLVNENEETDFTLWRLRGLFQPFADRVQVCRSSFSYNVLSFTDGWQGKPLVLSGVPCSTQQSSMAVFMTLPETCAIGRRLLSVARTRIIKEFFEPLKSEQCK